MPSVWTYKYVNYCFYCIEFRNSYYHSTSRFRVGTIAFFFQEVQIRISAQIPVHYIEVFFFVIFFSLAIFQECNSNLIMAFQLYIY